MRWWHGNESLPDPVWEASKRKKTRYSLRWPGFLQAVKPSCLPACLPLHERSTRTIMEEIWRDGGIAGNDCCMHDATRPGQVGLRHSSEENRGCYTPGNEFNSKNEETVMQFAIKDPCTPYHGKLPYIRTYVASSSLALLHCGWLLCLSFGQLAVFLAS